MSDKEMKVERYREANKTAKKDRLYLQAPL